MQLPLVLIYLYAIILVNMCDCARNMCVKNLPFRVIHVINQIGLFLIG